METSAQKKYDGNKHHSEHVAANDNHPPKPKLVIDNTRKKKVSQGRNIAINRANRRRTPSGNKVHEEHADAHSSTQKRMRRGHQILGIAKNPKTLRKSVKAWSRGGVLAYSLIGFWVPQLLFFFLFLYMLHIEEDSGVAAWLLRFTIDEHEILILSWVAIMVIGTLSMIWALFFFITNGIKVNKASIMIGFAICFAGYWTPFVFFMPWVIIWIAEVILNQD